MWRSKNTPRDSPLTTSTKRPNTSVARLYSQTLPGSNISGMSAKACVNAALLRCRELMLALAYCRCTGDAPKNS
jgi:hypothetical protein